MITGREDYPRVLAIYPGIRGVAYAVLEGPQSLIDWGLRRVTVTGSDKNDKALTHISQLMEQFRPSFLAIESLKRSRRNARLQDLLLEAVVIAAKRRIRLRAVTRTQAQEALSPNAAITKYQMAHLIAGHFPELVPRLPRFRKTWMREDPRMDLFDAVALALAFYSRVRPPKRHGDSLSGSPWQS